MPCYDYKCQDCGHEFEKIVLKYDTEAKQECPKCGGEASYTMPAGSRSGVKFLFNYLAPDS